MLEQIAPLSKTLLRLRNRHFKRYLNQAPNFTNRFCILIGQRGIGKTTIITQYLSDIAQKQEKTLPVLYVQADHFLVSQSSLYRIAEEFYNHGGAVLAIDEIHKYPNWSMELKSIYDTFTNLQIIASGSSALEITKGSHDLSRRALVSTMYGMSFREFIGLHTDCTLDSYSLESLLYNHGTISDVILETLEKKGLTVLELFKRYLEHGYYPYYLEHPDTKDFYVTLEQSVRTTLESDLPAIHRTLTGTSIYNIRKLLAVISASVPFTPDLKHLKELIGIRDERTLKHYLHLLEDAGIILSVPKFGKGLRSMEKPAKIYLNNTNLCYALSGLEQPNIGAVRETFFMSMLRTKHTVAVPQYGDFIIDNTYTVEIGGKHKNKKQVYSSELAWVVRDGIEVGHERILPLWLLGFLY